LADYFVPTMRLYLDRLVPLVDWQSILHLRSGGDVNVEHSARRISENATGRLDLDRRLLARVAPA